MNRRTAALLLFYAVATLPAGQGAAAEHPSPRQHGSHVHGSAQLNLAVGGKTVLVELLSPALNIVGFEHLPSTADQRRKVHEAAKLLEDGGSLFAFSEEAGCALVSAEIDSPLLAHEDEDEHADDDSRDDGDHRHETAEEHGEQGHSEFEARYQFSCSAPEKLKVLRVNIFNAFPGFDEIEVQMLTSGGQSGADLTAGANQLNF